MFKKLISVLLCPIFALPLLTSVVSVSASTVNSTPDRGIVGEWMWGSTVADAGKDGAETIMARCADVGVTDVYLLVKGTGGTLGYLKTKYANVSRKDRDILQEVIDAAHPRGIRVHAWICNMEDSNYKALHKDAGMWHYVRARDNDKINLYDEGYLEYMTTVAAELAAYDIDGLHFDYIRYNHLANGWGENDFAALAAMGANIERVKELIETTFGYNGRTKNDNYIFNAYNAKDPDALLIAKYRTGNVKNYAKKIIDAAKAVKPNLIISAATMPEGAYNEAYGDLHYGQNYKDAAELYDYICPMAYSSSYGQGETWILNITQNAISKGNKVVIGLQAYDPSNTSRLMSEIDNFRSFMSKDEYKGKALGIVFFRAGTFAYAKTTCNTKEKIITVKILFTQNSKAARSVLIRSQGGLKITGASMGEGIWGDAKLSFAKNGSYVKITSPKIFSSTNDAYIYIRYEGEPDFSVSPVTVSLTHDSDAIVYTASFDSSSPNADTGTPGTFETAPAVTTKPKDTTANDTTTVTDTETSTQKTTDSSGVDYPKGGCGSVIGGSVASVISAAIAAAVIRKKKKLD